MLCAQNALNNVLQGHFFDAVQLAQIARELTAYERAELGAVSTDPAAQHMDDSGFFSADVLERAFATWDMRLVRWRPHESLRERYARPECELAFVLNLDRHWFALRGFGSRERIWFNLNSFLNQPQWIGTAYLSTFLHTAQHEGYVVYVVVADEPMSVPENIADHVADQRAAKRAKAEEHVNESAIPVSDDSDPELQAAIRASMEDTPRVLVSQGTPGRRRGRVSSSDNEEPQRNRLRGDDSPPPRRRRGRKSQRDSSPVDGVDDDTDEVLAERMRSSPFLNPIATSLFNDDVEELESEPETTHVKYAPEPTVVSDSDDENEQLQAVLAASLGKPFEVSQSTMEAAKRRERSEPASVPEPEPLDVQRIRAMREQKRESPQPVQEPPQDKRTESTDEPAADSDSDAPEAPSAEEMRRRRLARFG